MRHSSQSVPCVKLNISALGNNSYPELREISLKNLLLFCLHKISVLHLLIAAEIIVELITFQRENLFLFKLEITLPERDIEKNTLVLENLFSKIMVN